jgi:hypothetical protein
MKHYTLLAVLAMLCMQAFGQQDEPRNCGSMDYLQEMDLADPTFKKERLRIDQHCTNYAVTHSKPTRTIIKIPVVVHVVYNTTQQNISDAQVYSQLTVLNADFRKLNSDFTNTPSFFQQFAEDCQIEFCLASIDPKGAATNGITRTFTTKTSFANDNQVKYINQGGQDAWPRDKYLNIWVCKLTGSLLGYAQYPGGAAATDGVVIATRAFGTIPGNGLSPVFNKGRTATHEIGHWLNLYHIWGDDGTACWGSDQVNDTPNHDGANTGCPVYPLSSSCNTDLNGDMFMNYMDYSNDACMTMFTRGQSMRINALFAAGGFRVPLLSSNGCGNNSIIPSMACGNVEGITYSISSKNIATINWNPIPEAIEYVISYRIQNSAANNSFQWLYTSINEIQLPLIANEVYEFQIQSKCNAGMSEYSAVQLINNKANTQSSRLDKDSQTLSIYPQPASKTVFGTLFALKGSSAQIEIYNTFGQKLLTVNKLLTEGENKFQMDLNNLSNGIYYLNVKYSEHQIKQKFVVLH